MGNVANADHDDKWDNRQLRQDWGEVQEERGEIRRGHEAIENDRNKIQEERGEMRQDM